MTGKPLLQRSQKRSVRNHCCQRLCGE